VGKGYWAIEWCKGKRVEGEYKLAHFKTKEQREEWIQKGSGSCTEPGFRERLTNRVLRMILPGKNFMGIEVYSDKEVERWMAR